MKDGDSGSVVSNQNYCGRHRLSSKGSMITISITNISQYLILSISPRINNVVQALARCLPESMVSGWFLNFKLNQI